MPSTSPSRDPGTPRRTTRATWRLCVLPPLVAIALALRSALAQQPDTLPRDTTTLAPVVVTGVRLPTVGELARGLAGRTATLSAQDLDARGVRSLADALEQLPGVTTADELGATAQLDVSLRGFQVSPVIGVPQGVTVYVDGVRANEPDAHEVNFDLLPLEDVERVDVVYGPSVLLGRNALGAAVNLVTRRGGVPATRELEASAGSWGRYELKGHAGARYGLWDYYLGARYEHEQGWRQHTESRVATLFAKVGHLGNTWDATLSYSGADNRIFQAGSLPDRLAAARPDSNFTSGDYFAPQAHLVILNAQRLLGRTQLAVNGFGRSFASEQFNVNFVGTDSRQRNVTGAGGGAVQLSGKLGLGARALSWLAGVDADYEHVAVRIFGVPRNGAPDSLTASVRTQQVSAGAFAGASVEVVPRLTATFAGRYDWIRVPFEDLLNSAQNGVTIFPRLSPRVGVTWRAHAHEAFASVSRGFRAPAVVELGCADPQATCPLPFALGPDPALKPVVATTYELGWHYHAPPGGLDASANAYRTDLRDEIFFIASSVTGGYFQNIGATRRSGVELALQWVGPAGQRAYVNYGYTHATFEATARLATTRDTTGETVRPGDVLPMVPDHRLNAGVALPLLNPGASDSRLAVTAGLDARYVGGQWLRGDEANVTARLPDYLVADLSLTLAWHAWELRWALGNVLDRRYVSFGTFAQDPTVAGRPVQRWLAPGPPRHLQVSLSSDF